MLAMILIHTNAYYLSNKTSFFLWDISQFAVPSFVFCSAFLYFQKAHVEHKYLSYLKKRFLRLLVPYYIFLLFFIPMVYLHEPSTFKLQYLFESIFLIGGVDIDWLILLFLYFAALFPVLFYLEQKQKLLFYIYSFLAVGSSILLTFYKFPYDYKYIMWLPWSIIVLYAMYFVKHNTHRLFPVFSLLLSAIISLSFLLIEQTMNHSLVLYDNKYPPNIYYLSYGIFVTTLLFYIGKYGDTLIHRFIHFLSIYSYPIYFVHFFILVLVSYTVLYKWPFSWYSYFGLVLVLTFLVQIGINKLLQIVRFRNKNSANP